MVMFTEVLVYNHFNGFAGPNSGFGVFSGSVKVPIPLSFFSASAFIMTRSDVVEATKKVTV